MANILVADTDARSREHLQRLLGPTHRLDAVTDPGKVRGALDHGDSFDLVIADLGLMEVEGAPLIEDIQRRHPGTAVILTAAFGSVDDAVRAMRGGAADFLSKPFTDDQLHIAVDRALERAGLERENRSLRAALEDRQPSGRLIATDPAMQRIFKMVRSVADTRTTVLITGESGTGKTMLARALHDLSSRRDGPFVEVNCGALPENLLESELFGHVRGAFTGAVKDRAGRFEAAQGGTVFLDEIGTSSPGFQVRLLRVLQDRVVERVGDTEERPVDVRVVLATNIDLEKAVAEGTFREDLYYRIHVVTLEMPPLRARPSDVPLLARHFLERVAAENERPITGFTDEALERLCRAPWPGNVRQLENVIERAVVLAEGDRIGVVDLPASLSEAPAAAAPAATIAPDAHLLPLKQALEQSEKVIIERALAHHDGNREATARALGINRSTLFNKLRKLGIR